MIRWPQSLTARIVLAQSAVVVLLALLPTFTITLMHRTMAVYQERQLNEQAVRIAGGVSLQRGQLAVRLGKPLAALYAVAYDGRSFAIVDAHGQVLEQSSGSDVSALANAPHETSTRFFRAPPYLGVSLPIASIGRPLWVVVMQDESRPGAILDDVARQFLRQHIAFLVCGLAVLPLVNILLIRRLVRAVGGVSARAAQIGPGNLDERLPEEELPSEVRGLAGATNRLLGRLQASFEQQRQFVANVVHELKTPLATLKAELDGLADRPTRERLNASVDRLSHVISQMRDLAALENLDQDRAASCDLRRIAEDVVSRLAPAIYAAGDDIALEIPEAPVLVRAEPTLLELAAANLVDNASRHTPPGRHIVVTVTPDRSLAVRDDGPGVASSEAEALTRRFWRADRSRSDTAGLGLSIVERIVAAHRGRLEIETKPGAGSCFTIRLPADDEASEVKRSEAG